MFDFDNTGLDDSYSYNSTGSGSTDSNGSFWDSITGYFDTGLEIAESVLDYQISWDNLTNDDPLVSSVTESQSVADQIANTNSQSKAGFTIAGISPTYLVAGGLAMLALFLVARAK